MQYEEHTTVGTPEGLALEYGLAGLGSRFIALAIDLFIEISILGCVGFVLAFLAGLFEAAGIGTGVAVALGAIAFFGSFYGYEIGFLTLRQGQTPGKQVTGLRVIKEDGLPVDFKAATIRTVVGLIDGPLTFWIVGATSIAVSKRNQRLGDMAAGTLVIRERRAADRQAPPPPPPGVAAPAPEPPAEAGVIDLTALSDSDLATVRAFLSRRASLEAGARARLANQIAAKVRPLVAGALEDADPEGFLEQVDDAAAARR